MPFFDRMDSTLVDFTDMKWQRGDLTFIFNGDAKGKSYQSLNCDNFGLKFTRLMQYIYIVPPRGDSGMSVMGWCDQGQVVTMYT